MSRLSRSSNCRIAPFALLSLLVLVAACGSDIKNTETIGDAGPDTGIGFNPDTTGVPGRDVQTGKDIPVKEILSPDIGVDAGVDVPENPNYPPCVDNSDCNGGFCLPSAYGNVCSPNCVTECPAGWACRAVGMNPDIIYVCVDLSLVACRPCVDSGDCAEARVGLDGHCLAGGAEGNFCGTVCNDDGDCPPGYGCQTGETTEGATPNVCVKSDGQCECTPFATQSGAWTTCAHENDLGSCAGTRRCTADGLTGCDAPEPMAEVCDHLDNDCDGLTDEEVADPNAIGDACDDDDDDDGVLDVDDCAPQDPTIGICDDGNPCTDDACNEAFQQCAHAPRAGDCDDGDACTTGDHCEGGACVFTAYIEVDDGDSCTDDGCDPATGPWHAPLDQVPCDDSDPCTVGERCFTGLCMGGDPLDCDDGDICTDDTCISYLEGGCLHTFNTGECDDGDPCTVGDRCDDGICLPAGPKDCNDDDPCTADSCEPGTGECINEVLPDGTTCDDGDLCNGVFECEAGACVEVTTPVHCQETGLYCLRSDCDPTTGACFTAPVNEGDVCDDSDPCNGVSFCREGTCTHEIDPVTCVQDGDPCTEAFCNSEGRCDTRYVNDCCLEDEHCDDGDPCTDDICASERCTYEPNALSCHLVVIQVVMPEGAPPLSEAAYVVSPWGRHTVDVDGTARINALNDAGFPVVLVDAGLELLAAVVPPDATTVTADVEATARTVLFLYSNGLALPADRFMDWIEFVDGFDSGSALAAAIQTAVVAGESPFDPFDVDLRLGLAGAMNTALNALHGWAVQRPLGDDNFNLPGGSLIIDPYAGGGFGLSAEQHGADSVTLSVENRTPKPFQVRITWQLDMGEELVADQPGGPGGCCDWASPFAGTFGDAVTPDTTDFGPFMLDPGSQQFEVVVLSPGSGAEQLAGDEQVAVSPRIAVWLRESTYRPVITWLESLTLETPGAGCFTAGLQDWLEGRSLALTADRFDDIDLSDETSALLADAAHARLAFAHCQPSTELSAYADVLHVVSSLARETPTLPTGASFGWLAGERARPARVVLAARTCMADCSGAQCGDDGCGGSCGTCDGGLNCIDRACVCEGTCGAIECGPSPCGEDCGTCGAGRHCDAGVCACDPPEITGCFDDRLYWLDGCGQPVGDPVEQCQFGCADGREECNECDPLTACCQLSGDFVAPNVQSEGCTGTCRACDGAGSCGPATDGSGCTGGVCVGGVCKSCLPSDPCCTSTGDFVGAGLNGNGCNGECQQCNGNGECVDRPDRVSCSTGVCWQGACQQCEPNSRCCTPSGTWVPFGEQGSECTGTCQTCNGAGTCGRAPDGYSCGGDGTCVGGTCRDCLPGTECCNSSGYYLTYGSQDSYCRGDCEQCDGYGDCTAKAWHTSCGSGRWCEGTNCVSMCTDECFLGQSQCAGSWSMEICGDWDTDDCLEFGNERDCDCGCDRGECVDELCTPNSRTCVGDELRTCHWDGCDYDTEQCACGCSGGSCSAQLCTPGERRCSGLSAQQCSSDGCSWQTVESCPCTCDGGYCGALTGTITIDSVRDGSASFDRNGYKFWRAGDHADTSPDRMFNTGAYNADMVFVPGPTGGGNSARWFTTERLCGSYAVEIHLADPDAFDPNMDSSVQPNLWYDCTSVTYEVTHDGSPSGQSFNRSQAGSGWVSLGTFQFTDREGEVYLDDVASPWNCSVLFDAVRWRPL